jgi:hypothetical protein
VHSLVLNGQPRVRLEFRGEIRRTSDQLLSIICGFVRSQLNLIKLLNLHISATQNFDGLDLNGAEIFSEIPAGWISAAPLVIDRVAWDGRINEFMAGVSLHSQMCRASPILDPGTELHRRLDRA